MRWSCLSVWRSLLRNGWVALREERRRFGVRGSLRRLPWHLRALPARLRMLGQPAATGPGEHWFSAPLAGSRASPQEAATSAGVTGRLRVAYAVHQFLPEFAGGTERAVFEMARATRAAGHHVEVISGVVDERWHGDGPHPSVPGLRHRVHQGLEVSLVPGGLLGLQAFTGLAVHPPALEPMAAWLRAGRFEVLHLWHPLRMVTLAAAARQAGVPVVLTLTDFFLACRRYFLVDAQGQACLGPEQGRRCARRCPAPGWELSAWQDRHRLASALLEAASARLVPSRFMATRLSEIFPGVDFQVVPHGVDVEGLRAGAATGAPSIPPAAMGVRRLLFVGTIVPAKGLDVLVRALHLLPGRPLQLVVVGPFGHDRDHELEIRALAARDDRVQLVGALDRAALAAVMAASELLCLPSRVPESFSLVLHEAAALGLPALVADRGAPAEAVRSRGGGDRVSGDRPQDWAAALQAWLDDAHTRERWRAGVQAPDSVEDEAGRLAAIYRSVRVRPQPAGS